MAKFKLTFLILCSVTFLQSCALRGGTSVVGQLGNATLTAPGSLVINRPAPKIEQAKAEVLYSDVGGFGFTPIARNSNAFGISGNQSDYDGTTVSLSDKKLTIKKQGIAHSFNIESIKDFVPGVYKVLLIQEKPTWYADDNYYIRREISSPKPNSKERFLKGVLGPKAIYLSKDITLHSSNYLADDAKGLRFSADEIEGLSMLLSVGGTLLVK